VQRLVAASALEGESMQTGSMTTMLKPDWRALLVDLDETTATLKGIFLR
jgi:hypothetical protein